MGIIPVRTHTKVATHKADHKTTLDAKKDMYKDKPDSAGKTYQEKTRDMSKEDKEKYRREHPEEYAAYSKDKQEVAGYQYYKDGKKDIKDKSGLSGFMAKGSTQFTFAAAPLALMALPMLQGNKDEQQQPDPTSNGMPPVTA